MKKTIIALILLCAVLSSFAQQGVNTVDKKGLNYIVASYSPVNFTASNNGLSESVAFNGISVGYTRGQVLAKFPLYLDFGAQFTYMSSNKTSLNDNYTGYCVSIPVNVAYRLSFNSGKIHLTPFTGPYFRYILNGKYGDNDLNFGSGGVKRFQLGWQAGVGFSYKAFYVNVGYSYDLTKVVDIDYKNCFHGFTFGIGVVL